MIGFLDRNRAVDLFHERVSVFQEIRHDIEHPFLEMPSRIEIVAGFAELLNSDSGIYGGQNIGNAGGLPSEDFPWQGRPYSLQVTVPPLAMLVLKRK